MASNDFIKLNCFCNAISVTLMYMESISGVANSCLVSSGWLAGKEGFRAKGLIRCVFVSLNNSNVQSL